MNTLTRGEKMERPNIIKIVGLSLLVFCLFIPSINGAEKRFSIKIATLAPEGSSWMKTFKALTDEVMKKTENNVQFKIYPGGILGDERDMLRKMRIGQIHAAALTAGGLGVLFTDIDVLQIPFLFQNYGEVDYLLTKMDTYFKTAIENNGYILLGWTEAGFIYLMSNTPISRVSDLKKVKVWIWEDSPMSKAIFNEAGVAAIPLSIPDVLIGLQTGLVDVVYTPPTGAIALQWFTKIKYITNVPLVYIVGGIVIKKDIFKKLPQPSQNIILESCQRHLAQSKTVTRNENQEALKVMEKHGVKIISPSKDHIDEFKMLWDRAKDRLGTQCFSKKVFDEVSSHLEHYRKGGK